MIDIGQIHVTLFMFDVDRRITKLWAAKFT